jgi:C1A family cysteine protease
MRYILLLSGALIVNNLSAQIKVDYRAYQSSVKNQYNRGTCTAFAILAAMETQPGFPSDLSEQYTYANVKMTYYDSMPEYDEGAKISNYLKTLQYDGMLREDQMPYNPDAPVWDKNASNFKKMQGDINGARLYDLLTLQDFSYHLERNMYTLKTDNEAKDVEWIKKELDRGVKSIPVGYSVNGKVWFKHGATREDKIDPALMFQVVDGEKVLDYKVARLTYSNLSKQLLNGSLRVRLKDTALAPNEGHAVTIVGYDENGFLIKNSWGEQWGEKGYGWVSFDYHRLFCRQAMSLPVGKVQVAAWARELSWQPQDLYLKSLPGPKKQDEGMQLSLVFHSKGAPARLKEINYEIYDCNGKLLETLPGYIKGIFDGRDVGYNTYVLLSARQIYNPSCDYTIKASFTTSTGQKFTNSYQHVIPFNREYAPNQ